MKYILLLLLVVAPFCSLLSQNKGTIKGTLKDSAAKQPLSLATVTVFQAKDTAIITYRLSNEQGIFTVPSIPLDVLCRMVVSFQGYKVYRKEFQLTKGNSQLDLGNIFMSPDQHSLDEVLVIAERPPVVMRKDTIEFNASAFKSLPSALVEDLLKKLPGVDVDTDGNITVNGRKVNKLMVDGKEFFGGDPKIATRNLPANIVDKIQVVDDKEELDRDPNIAKADLGQVVNIKLKKAIKQGWFGKAYAGMGTNTRHEAGAIVNIFRDTTQISLLAYSNNVNKPGFGINDVQKIGGFGRSGITSMGMSSDGGFSINGVSFGGGFGQGLQRSAGGGFNFNNQYGKRVTLNLQYFYGQVNTDYTQLNNTRRFFNDTTQTSASTRTFSSVNMNHRIGGTVIWKADSFTTITFRGGVTLTKTESESISSSAAVNNFKGPINKSDLAVNSDGKGRDFSQGIYLTRNFRKRGRYFTVSTDVSANRNNNDQFNDGKNTFYESGQAADSLINQLRQSAGSNTRANVNASYSEPLGKKWSTRISHIADYIDQQNDINFFLKDMSNGKYEIFSQPLSNGYEKKGWRNTTSVEISYKGKKATITPGVNFFRLDYTNHFVKNPVISQHISNVYPYLNMRIGIFNFNYRVNTNEPQAQDLQQVIDISNPLYQQYGNPNLQPAIAHNLNVSTFKFDPKNGSSWFFNLGGSFTQDAIIRETTLDSRGVQTSRPINVNGVKSFNSSFNYNYQYKLNKDFRLSVRPSAFLGYSKGLLSVNGNRSEYANINASPSLGIGFNYKDKIELNQRYGMNIRQSNYDDNTRYKDVNVVSHSSESEVILRWPKHIVWENLVNYSYNPQVSAGLRKTSVRWNAGVNFLFLKEDKGQLKLSVFDLLGQNVSVNTSTNENYVSDSQTTTLTRYFMLSFTYNIRNFSGGKVGGSERRSFMLF